MTRKSIILATTAALAAVPALAQQAATASTDLNLRAGPGSNYEIRGVIPADASVEITGCIEGYNWCEVSYDGQTGFAYGEYLNVMAADAAVAVPQAATQVEINTVTFDETNDAYSATIGGAAGAAVAGAIIGGPAAIAAGLIAGAVLGERLDPDPQVITYVQQNPVDPIFAEGEVAVNAVLPAEIVLTPVPDAAYSYANVNGQYVLVAPEDRRIVYVVR